ncbi:MAG: DNA polymerase III subunit gamma/tau [Candidatus Sericytochromatia bacterium]|nr:DNA polymerase III subunit gamma/tau [Candidatus Sericytochromatia bacterium]
MARHEALYRKYRPQTFGDLEGQDPISRTLRNEIRQGRLTHAYLFTGPRGTGKTTTARLLAKALNCVGGPAEERQGADPCGRCSACRAIEDKSHLDVIEIDAASNRGLEHIQELQQRTRLAPLQGQAKVFIVDEVHMLTDAAWNALLKTLEEPPAHCTFILATTEVHKVLPTVVSRCQRFDFRRIPLADLTGRLAHVAECERIVPDAPALAELARRADGGLRDGLSLLEQVAATVEPDEQGFRHLSASTVAEALGLVSEDTVLTLGDRLLEGDVVGAMQAARDILAAGHDHRAILRELLAWTRDLVLVRLAPDAVSTEVRGQVVRDRLLAQAARAPEAVTDAFLAILRETDGIMRGTPQWQVWLEVALLRMSRPLAAAPGRADHVASGPDPRVTVLESRLEALERRLAAQASSGSSPASSQVAPPQSAPPQRAVQPAAPPQELPPAPREEGPGREPAPAAGSPLPPVAGDEGGAFGEALRQDRAREVVPRPAVPPPSARPAPAPSAPEPAGEDVRNLVGDAIRRGMHSRRSAILLGSLQAATWDAVANKVMLTLDKEIDAYKEGMEGRQELEQVIRGCFRADTHVALLAWRQGRGTPGRSPAAARPASPPPAAARPTPPAPTVRSEAFAPAVSPTSSAPGGSNGLSGQSPSPAAGDSFVAVAEHGASPGVPGPEDFDAEAPVAEGPPAERSVDAPMLPSGADLAGDPEATVALAADIFLGRIIRG